MPQEQWRPTRPLLGARGRAEVFVVGIDIKAAQLIAIRALDAIHAAGGPWRLVAPRRQDRRYLVVNTEEQVGTPTSQAVVASHRGSWRPSWGRLDRVCSVYSLIFDLTERTLLIAAHPACENEFESISLGEASEAEAVTSR